MKSIIVIRALVLFALAFLTVWPMRSAGAPADRRSEGAPRASVTELSREADPDDATKVTLLLSVKFAPGAESAPHRHPGFIVGYVLSGELEFQLQGQPSQHLKPGDHFYEPPGAVHLVSRNPGRETTEVLVFAVQPKDQPVVLPMH